MKTIAWPKLMQAGFTRLRLTPEQFWELTPAELMMMLGLGSTDAPLSRSGLERLIAAFPDEEKGPNDGGT